MHQQPQGAAFDLVLLLHVGCAVIGIGTTLTAAAMATRLRGLLRAQVPLPDAVRRYYRPGVNWVGRAMYGVPVFGFALVAMSQGAYSLGDAWVLGGLGLFLAVAVLAEGMMWPAEHRVRTALTGALRPGAGPPAAASGEEESVERDAVVLARSAGAALVLLLAAMVIMVAQP